MFEYLDEEYCILGNTLLSWSGKGDVLHLPSKINGHKITVIGCGAFCKCKHLREVYIEEGYEKIENYAFAECSELAKVEIPDTVTFIGDHVFDEGSKLAEVRMSLCLTSLGERVFSDCVRLKSIVLPANITDIAHEKSIGRRGYEENVLRYGCDIQLYFKAPNEQFIQLMDNHSIRLDGNGKYLLKQSAEQFNWLSTLEFFNTVSCVDEKMGALYFSEAPMIDTDPTSRRTMCKWNGFNGLPTEDAGYKLLISKGADSYSNANDEAQWSFDSIRHNASLPSNFEHKEMAPAICILESYQESADGESVEGYIRLTHSFVFFQSIRRLIYKGETYYIASRNFLAGKRARFRNRINDKPVQYYRCDLGVYKGLSIIYDRELAEKVYAKYKLFSIL